MDRDPSKADRRRYGEVYTPPMLANWAARILLRYLPEKRNSLVVDPACGNGALLNSFRGYTGKIEIIGIDQSARAISAARKKLLRDAQLKNADSLAPYSKYDTLEGWRRLLGGRSPDAVIANPPWGGVIKQPQQELAERGFTLARGQFDSFDLFMELSLRITREGGVCVFIVPDSIFLPEHKALRRLLLSKTQLLLIARLGEGFFEKIYRGTAVIAFRKAVPGNNHKISCFRLTKQWRDQILNENTTFEAAQRSLAHRIPQKRFLADQHHRFDIDLSEKESESVSKIERHIDGWVDWLDVGRGVELSKHGEILRCPRCEHSFPKPKVLGDIRACHSCGHSFSELGAFRDQIVLPAASAGAGWKPLIVGEDVDRYHVAPSRSIRTGIPGINYKDESLFHGRKMLVRKTGVGIKAAVDDSGAYTNQVVFIYRLRRALRPPEFLLYYFLGVLSSRVMLAYHLKKSGENEWRSHPYVTQRTIAELPVPNVKEGSAKWRQAQAIAEAVKSFLQRPNSGADIMVDNLVAGMFDLGESDCRWVATVLDAAQALEPIRTMQLKGQTITPTKI